MANDTRAPGGGSLTWLWMLLALIVVAGFLTWLGVASEPSSVAVVEGSEEEEAGPGGVTFAEVHKDTLAAGKARFADQQIRVANVQATGSLGSSVFWGELGDQSNQVPILVRMDSALAATGMQVQQGANYTITGLVQRMTDSVGNAWAEQNVFADEGARMQASFADYYIQASNIRPARSGSDGGTSSGGGDD